MNWYSIKNRIKYNWKRVLAIFFASVGTAIELTLLITYLFFGGSEGIDILSVISYLIVLAAYYYLLSGNIKGTTIAYRGFMLFVFFNLFDFGEILLISLITNGGLLFSGDAVVVAITITSLVLIALGFVSGLLTYISFRKYGAFGHKTTYETVRNWCLVFTICMLLAYGSILAVSIIALSPTADAITILLNCLEPISLICMSLCSYITILRLKD